MDSKITSLGTMIKEVKDCVSKMSEKNNDRLISWGVGIIGFLTACVIGLVVHIVTK